MVDSANNSGASSNRAKNGRNANSASKASANNSSASNTRTEATTADYKRVLAKPMLYRGIVSALFALVGVFFNTTPTVGAISAAFAVLFLTSALFYWPIMRLALAPSYRTAVTSAVLAWAIAGVLAIIMRDPAGMALAVAFGYTIGGASELYGGLTTRETGRPSKDTTISGGLGVIGGIIMVFMTTSDAHGVFGMASMITALIAVHLLISAVGYMQDQRRGN